MFRINILEITCEDGIFSGDVKEGHKVGTKVINRKKKKKKEEKNPQRISCANIYLQEFSSFKVRYMSYKIRHTTYRRN